MKKLKYILIFVQLIFFISCIEKKNDDLYLVKTEFIAPDFEVYRTHSSPHEKIVLWFRKNDASKIKMNKDTLFNLKVLIEIQDSYVDVHENLELISVNDRIYQNLPSIIELNESDTLKLEYLGITCPYSLYQNKQKYNDWLSKRKYSLTFSNNLFSNTRNTNLTSSKRNTQ